MVLKVSNNRINTVEQVKELAPCSDLTNLDLSENPVCKVENYRELVYAALPNVQVLDGHDRDGNSFISDDEDDYGEEGEMDMEEGKLQEIIANLDPETKKKFEAGELGLEDLKGMGLVDDSYGDLDEEGEDEAYGPEDDGSQDSNAPDAKKQRTD